MLVANATAMLSMPAWLFRVVAVTVTGAVVVVAFSGMNCGDDGPVLAASRRISTAANGENVFTVFDNPPPVVTASNSCGRKKSGESLRRAPEQAGRLDGQCRAGEAQRGNRSDVADLDGSAGGGDDVVARRDVRRVGRRRMCQAQVVRRGDDIDCRR